MLHLPLDRFPGVWPNTVWVRIVRSPQQVVLAEERNERHCNVIILECRVDLSLEEITWLRDEGAASLVGPEFLRLPEPASGGGRAPEQATEATPRRPRLLPIAI